MLLCSFLGVCEEGHFLNFVQVTWDMLSIRNLGNGMED